MTWHLGPRHVPVAMLARGVVWRPFSGACASLQRDELAQTFWAVHRTDARSSIAAGGRELPGEGQSNSRARPNSPASARCASSLAASPSRRDSARSASGARAWSGARARTAEHACPSHPRRYSQPAASPIPVFEALPRHAVTLGSVVEFVAGPSSERVTGVVTREFSRSWEVTDAGGATYSVRPPDVTLVLGAVEAPGSARGIQTQTQSSSARVRAALAALRGAVAPGASEPSSMQEDAQLVELAWELSEPGADLGVAPAALLFFGRQDLPACLSAHALLRADGLRFLPVRRDPPAYRARPPAQVAAARASLEARRRALQARESFAQAVRDAGEAPAWERPAPEAWRRGPFGEAVAALEAFAAGTGEEAERPDAVQTARAAYWLQALGQEPSSGQARAVLERMGVLAPHANAALKACRQSVTFAPELEAMAAGLASAPPEDLDLGWRRDLTQTLCLTVDDPATTEVDDGLGLEEGLPDPDRPGETLARVWVHVADPTRWIEPDSPLALEAARRAKSVYLPSVTVPMFPRVLAEGVFSLLEGAGRREALSIGVDVDARGRVVAVCLTPSFVAPRRLSYEQVDSVLANGGEDAAFESSSPGRPASPRSSASSQPSSCPHLVDPAVIHSLRGLRRLAQLREARRMAAGAVSIDLPGCEILVSGADESGERPPQKESTRIELRREEPQSSPARALVAEAMILAGEAAALLGQRSALRGLGAAGKLGPGRVDVRGVQEALSVLNERLRAARDAEGVGGSAGDAYDATTAPPASASSLSSFSKQPRDPLAQLFDESGACPLPYRGQREMVSPSASELALHPEGPARAMLLRSRMMRSTHSVSLAERHAGLGLAAYVQVTSPIRRFADLLAHWQLKAALRAWGEGGGALEQAGEEVGKEPNPLALSSVPFSPSVLEDLLVESAATTQRLVRVEREAEAYWAAAYFQAMRRRRGGRAAWRGSLLAWANQDLGLGRVVLEDLGLEVVASVPFPAAPGEEVWLRCEAAEPREGLLKLVAVPWQDVAREEVVREGVVDEV